VPSQAQWPSKDTAEPRLPSPVIVFTESARDDCKRPLKDNKARLQGLMEDLRDVSYIKHVGYDNVEL
jgi:hypothetical protein